MGSFGIGLMGAVFLGNLFRVGVWFVGQAKNLVSVEAEMPFDQ